MITNNMCEECGKRCVCKITDIINKFSDGAKIQLGVDITIDKCVHYSPENEELDENDEDDR